MANRGRGCFGGMSDPFGRMSPSPQGRGVNMDEVRVSASDFRVHLKDLGNEVARGGAAVIVSRHGLELGVFINRDEYAEFLDWRNGQGKGSESVPVEVPLDHPDNMPLEEVERVYRATAGVKDELIVRWRGR